MGEKRMGEKRHAHVVSALVAYLMLFSFSTQALSATITSWGYNHHNQVSHTPTGTGFTAIAAGTWHSLALGSDGSITSWGNDTWNQITNTPTGTGFTAIAAGNYHSLALATVVPLPASAWMGIVLLGAIGTMSVARKRLCAA